MRLRRALPPQSRGNQRHCWAEPEKPQERQQLKKAPKRRCYLIRLFVHCPITDRISMYIQHRRNSFLRISILSQRQADNQGLRVNVHLKFPCILNRNCITRLFERVSSQSLDPHCPWSLKRAHPPSCSIVFSVTVPVALKALPETVWQLTAWLCMKVNGDRFGRIQCP